MHRHFFIILHGKKIRSKNSQLLLESCLFPIHPFCSISPLFRVLTTLILIDKTSVYFVSPLSISLIHLGTVGTFFPERSISQFLLYPLFSRTCPGYNSHGCRIFASWMNFQISFHRTYTHACKAAGDSLATLFYIHLSSKFSSVR